MSESKYPTEIISLPSQGKVYSESSPLSKGEIEIKYMTAKEEEILSSQNLIKKGVVLDKLFESIIVDKSINPDDIIVGDKNAIMLATRILGYGKEYQIELVDEYDEKVQYTVDLSKIQTTDIDYSLLNTSNKFTFTTPVGKNTLEFKLLTHGDEKKIDADVKAVQRLSKGGTSSELTTRYRYMILSVDGQSDTKSINDFINNRFLTRDTKAFREFIKKINPNVNMEFEYEDPQTGEKEVRPIPMGVNFFWPAD